MDLASRCKTALTERLRELQPERAWLDGFCGYLARLDDNLFPEITTDLYREDYAAGAGSELRWTIRNGRRFPPKMQAAYSSSALVVNCFAPWKHRLGELELCGFRGFSSLQFEAKAPSPLGGTPPHLDFLADTLRGGTLGSESKATEFLQRHRAAFAPSYESVPWPKCVEGYIAIMRQLKADPSSFVYLNAAQLVKHAFGLSTTFRDRDAVLLYLYWEPENRDSHREFDEHSDELRRFAISVAGSSVKFIWMSYSHLWKEWAHKDVTWLRQHASKLEERYVVKI